MPIPSREGCGLVDVGAAGCGPVDIGKEEPEGDLAVGSQCVNKTSHDLWLVFVLSLISHHTDNLSITRPRYPKRQKGGPNDGIAGQAPTWQTK